MQADGDGVKDSSPIAGRTVTVRGSATGTAVRRLTARADAALGSAMIRRLILATAPAAAGGRAVARVPSRGPSRGLALARMLPALIGIGMLVGGIALVTQRSGRTWTVGEVTREMRRIALEGGEAATPMAGTLGPLRIAARTIDPATGDFLDFRIDSDRLLVTARRAVLMIDPDADTFAFDLHDVVFTRVPEPGEEPNAAAATGASALSFGGEGGSGGAGRSFVHTTARHLFGPAAFGQDIVPDAGARSSGGGAAGRRPAGGLSPRGANASEPANTGWLRDAGAD